MKNFKKILALVLVVVMAFGVSSMALADGESTTLPDIILDGGEEGESTMIGTFKAPTNRGQATDVYTYLGYASFLDMVPDGVMIEDGNYRYLVMTYTGDITKLRYEFERLGADGSQELQGPFWFDKENVLTEDGNFVNQKEGYFVTADGSDIPLIGDNTTVVIDLLNSQHPDNGIDLPGVNMDYYISGIHMHCEEMLTFGNGAGITISNAYLTTTLPEEETTEATTEADSTEASSEETTTEEATTAEATTETATTEEATTEEAAKMEAIVLDGGEEGKSTLIKKFTNTSVATDTNPAYKYLGYVTFKDLANENYKYLALKYTGDITNLRLQFVHDAGGANEEIDILKFWFNEEITVDDQNAYFVTADGSDIPLVGNDTTIFIDLEASGVGMDWYNSGLHVHVNDVADIDITYAALLTELPKEDDPLPTEDTVTAPSTEGTTTAAASGSNSPATGDVSPVVVAMAVCVLSLAVLGGAIVVRRRY